MKRLAGLSSRLFSSPPIARLAGISRLFSTPPTPRLADAVTTYPRPLGPLVKYIEKRDIVHDFGDMKLIRARPEHVCFLKDTFYDFFRSEATVQGFGLKARWDFAWGLVYNMTRYPFSHFVLNDKNEIIGMALQHVVYRKVEEDPRPPIEFQVHNAEDRMHLMANVLQWSEKRHFEVLNVNRFIHHEIAYTPSVLRRQKLASTWYPVVMRLVCEEAVKMGIRWSVGMTTSESNRRNILKLHYEFTERIPPEVYKDAEGKIILPHGEDTAYLCYLDMEEAFKKKLYG